MCRPLPEMGGGVDDLHCCSTQSREFLNQETADHSSQSITSFLDIKMSHCRSLVVLACCSGKLGVATFKLKVWRCSIPFRFLSRLSERVAGCCRSPPPPPP